MPPHILTEIINRGSPERAAKAINTLIQTERLRGKRQTLNRYDLTSHTDNGLYRIIKSGNNKQSVIGPIERKEGQPPTNDQAVNEAYDYAGNSYNFFYQNFNRNSTDNKGAKLISIVHYGTDFDNAFWDGEHMVFGDGDGEIFQRFTKCPEVIGHELTHGVTENQSNLVYEDQSGAINEAISDVFGSLIKQFTNNQSATEADWIIGEGLLEPSINGVGIRSIKAPGTAYNDPALGKDPCPASMKDYVNTKEDNGGIHINCTIPSHAFYISAIQLGGNAWEKMGSIWYNTVTTKLQSHSSFEQFAHFTMQSAVTLYGNHSLEHKAVHKGWKEVGVI